MSEKNRKKYWKGVEEREFTPEFRQTLESEFPAKPEEIESFFTSQKSDVSRRSFLKIAGFSVAGSMIASCVGGSIEKSIPVLVKPEEITPGKAYWYATTCAGCNASCGILTKNRDGRPIKIEGNTQHLLSKGGVCAVGQAMVLGLYDTHRLQKPKINGQDTTSIEIDKAIASKLAEINDNVYFLTGTLSSPSTKAIIQKFLAKYSNSKHIEYDAVSYSAILDSHKINFGQRVLPHYNFSKADVIVSFDADFLGTWISPVEFTKDYTNGRKLAGKTPKISKHFQLEGRMSVSGANADRRIKVTQAEEIAILLEVAKEIALKSGSDFPILQNTQKTNQKIVNEIVNELWQAKGKSLVVCGINDVNVQNIVNFINEKLENYGQTIGIANPSKQWNGNDAEVQELVAKMKNGEVKALFVADSNPAYTLPNSEEFKTAFSKIPLTVSFADHVDETSGLAKFIVSTPHFLESWNDVEVVSGTMSVSQPTVVSTKENRTVRQTLSTWLGEETDDLRILQKFWEENIFTRSVELTTFQTFWDNSVHDGFVKIKPQEIELTEFISGKNAPEIQPVSADSYELVLYQKVGMLEGKHAQNAWLQELSDPVTKAVWDNYVCLSSKTAKKLGVKNGDVLKVDSGGVSVNLMAQIQPGQHENVVAIAVGYGRMGTERFAKIGPRWIEGRKTVEENKRVGENAYYFSQQKGTNISFSNKVQLTKTSEHRDLALTQTHHTITEPEELGGERRDMVRETTLASFIKNPASGNPSTHKTPELWEQDFKYEGHHWAMSIDLGKCTGCSACVISCQAENNIPVVGKDEVFRRREMQWLRIDRYYSGENEDEDIDTLHQPVMCQHCDHAPCEGVCPVLATVHSDEGLNQQIYNRCVGTRYCANNCPYKVRRFNWFDYWNHGEKENLVLNPDITTRSRGVMEKCSMCVQRIQEAKAEAKRLGKPVADGEIKLACQQSCPADAIVFGDVNDAKSEVSKTIADARHYTMLEEMNFRTSVGYLTKVRNRDEEISDNHDGHKG
ncbi:TAT-variant-translocated molybdopterin oxidoreductase [bacterium]|nr:TAT-variant-translocated molybdopterin oxidoreductase [bacterium]